MPLIKNIINNNNKYKLGVIKFEKKTIFTF